MKLIADVYFEALDKILTKRDYGTEYSLHGYKDCAICVQCINDKWLVYNGERGNHYEEIVCSTPLEVCVNVIHRISVDYDEKTDMEEELIKILSKKIKAEDLQIKYWIYELKMSEETKELLDEICEKDRLTYDEFYEEALKEIIRRTEENPEGYKEYLRDSLKNNESDTEVVRYYPVYQGETEAQALDRKLKEEAMARK